MRLSLLKTFAVLGILLSALAPSASAEYAVLRSGQRLHILGYENRGATVFLRLRGGSIEVAASELIAIEPEEGFTAVAPPPITAAPGPAALPVPYAALIRPPSQKYRVDHNLIPTVILP